MCNRCDVPRTNSKNKVVSQIFFRPEERKLAAFTGYIKKCNVYVVIDSRTNYPRPLMLIVGDHLAACNALNAAGMWKRMWVLVPDTSILPESWAKIKLKD